MTIQQSLRSHADDGLNVTTIKEHLLVAAATIDALEADKARLTARNAHDRLVAALKAILSLPMPYPLALEYPDYFTGMKEAMTLVRAALEATK